MIIIRRAAIDPYPADNVVIKSMTRQVEPGKWEIGENSQQERFNWGNKMQNKVLTLVVTSANSEYRREEAGLKQEGQIKTCWDKYRNHSGFSAGNQGAYEGFRRGQDGAYEWIVIITFKEKTQKELDVQKILQRKKYELQEMDNHRWIGSRKRSLRKLLETQRSLIGTLYWETNFQTV